MANARQAQLEDVEQLLRWIPQLYGTDIVFDEPVVRAALEHLIADQSLGRVWLLLGDDETPAGYMVVCFGYSLEFGGRDAFIDELFVAAEQRGRGIGRWAVEFAARACRDLGVNALHLEVDHANTRAQTLYRSAGFEDHERYLMTRRLR